MKKYRLLFIISLIILSCNNKKVENPNLQEKLNCFTSEIKLIKNIKNKTRKSVISKEDLIIEKSTNKKKELIVFFKDFSLKFQDINSIDLPIDDFEILNINDTLKIKRQFLESDELYSKSFIIESKKIDSLFIEAIYFNDFVFYGQEKIKTPLRLKTIDTLNLKSKNGFFQPAKINDYKPIISQSIINRAKCINIGFYNGILNSNDYGENDKNIAKEKLKKIANNSLHSLDDLFVTYDNIKVIININIYIKNKSYIESLLYYN